MRKLLLILSAVLIAAPAVKAACAREAGAASPAVLIAGRKSGRYVRRVGFL